MKKSGLLIYFTFYWMFLGAQVFPEVKPVFYDREVSRIDILIPPDSLAIIYNTLENEYEYHATFIFHNSLIPYDTVTNIGLRLRGGTSLYSQKKSFKVSFNTYAPGRKFYGLEKMNLNGEHNDPSVIRSKLCWDLCRKFGIPASRACHTELYINGNYYGLYMNVEHIDDQFVKKRFGNNDGNLYKCSWGADLTYLGADPDLYKWSNSGTRVYELHTNEQLDDYSDLAHFIDVLNNTTTDSLRYKLDQVFNIQSYLKYLAFECIAGHWDGYSYNMNNYYLYHNTATGKFEFIVYDLDNTFGIDWMNIDWANRNIYYWMSNDPRPLSRRLLQDPYYKSLFSLYVKQFLKDCFNQQALFPRIDSIYSMILPYATTDPYRPLDYGWSIQQFTLSYTQALQGHVKYGLKPYITTRYNSAMQQLILPSTPNLVINEFMAANSNTIPDEFGEYDDWVEIYNPGTEAVWMGDKYLTDNLNIADKWQMPAITMDPDSYLLIWADNQVVQGDHHANFKLSKEGEQLGIFTSPSQGSLPVDILTFGAQTDDISFGCYPNGTGIRQFLSFPTPNAPNSIPFSVHELSHGLECLVYPNPFSDVFTVKFEGQINHSSLHLQLYDLAGRILFREEISSSAFKEQQEYTVSGLNLLPGLYYLNLQAGKDAAKTIPLLSLPKK